ENVGVDDEVVVRWQLVVDVVEAPQVVAAACIRILHSTLSPRLAEPLCSTDARGAYVGRRSDEDAECLLPLCNGKRSSVRDDHRVASRLRPLDRLADQRADIVAVQLLADSKR